MKKQLFLFSSLFVLALTACGSSNETSITPPSKDPAPIVFIMAGQSNMEGNSYFDNGKNHLRNAFTELGIDDGDVCFDGITTVKTSYYGTGYGELDDLKQVHASNTENKIEGKFLPTKVGMGHTEKMMGPELGLAYGLKDAATEDMPIYLIKMGISGSGFAQNGTTHNWDVSKEGNLYETHFKTFIENNLKNIEDELGIKPELRGFLWHQGESDTDNAKIPLYKERMTALINSVKTDFEGFAKDEDKDNIAFIDCTLQEGNGAASLNKGVNDEKRKLTEESNMNFLIEGNEKGLEIATNGWGDVDGANGQLHYKTKSCFELGRAYANVILENGLLD